ncbi:hypothetical protein BDE27_2580 [Xenorhabdus ehlersii]|uniref:Uncharacterized protein n=1 Tax=Xenorhabdus ehlersii TaxID=290111 RepID=A0A2D0INQ8_9GAMM|nr:hypothetical protein [Xenorhabdus sp. TS4]PHM23462.1 hypothetical protein Xehl_02731 [Xenorhabdus ehlersii]RKE90688.1 hypothetical protein BDE27_2580 [Xenorhabdus ehlersii]
MKEYPFRQVILAVTDEISMQEAPTDYSTSIWLPQEFGSVGGINTIVI